MRPIYLPSPESPEFNGGIGRFIRASVLALPELVVDVVKIDRFSQLLLLLRLIFQAKKRWSAVWTHHVLPIGTIAWLASRLTGVPYVVFLHGLDFDNAIKTPRRRFIAGRVLRSASQVVTNSQALARQVFEKFSVSAKVIYPPLDKAFLTTELSQKTSAQHQPVLKLLTVGRLVERKGHLKVLRALAALPPNVHYTIVGEGNWRPAIEHEITRLNLSDRVCFSSANSLSDLIELYDSHDLFVLPATSNAHDREGFGIVYLEAAARGLPTVAVNSPGVNEAIIDGTTGILIDDNDEALITALKSLIADPDKRRFLGSAGRKRIEHDFSPDRFNQLINLSANSNRPLISVIVPSYNHAHTLGRCLQSILDQTYRPLQIIIVDDGSTDNTSEVIEGFRSKLATVDFKIISQPNAGANPARNVGWKEADGDFLIFADADVVMKPNMIEMLYRALDLNPTAQFAYSRFRFGWKLFRSSPFDPAKLSRLNYIHTTSLARAAGFPGFDEKIKRFQDWDVWLTITGRGGEGVFVPKTLFRVLIDGPSRLGSYWLPSLAYVLPWHWLKRRPRRIQTYEEAKKIIVAKHNL